MHFSKSGYFINKSITIVMALCHTAGSEYTQGHGVSWPSRYFSVITDFIQSF